jgi:hypothetical protein
MAIFDDNNNNRLFRHKGYNLCTNNITWSETLIDLYLVLFRGSYILYSDNDVYIYKYSIQYYDYWLYLPNNPLKLVTARCCTHHHDRHGGKAWIDSQYFAGHL